MSRVRVPIYGTPSKAVSVDPAATVGAIVGVNLYLQDGTVVTKEMLFEQTTGEPELSFTYWKLVREVPANVVALAETNTTGIYVITGAGSSATRAIANSANIQWTNGDGVADNPIADLTDIAPSSAGSILRLGFDAKGRRTQEAGATTDNLAEGSTNLYFTAARVRSTILTGLSLASSAAITAADTVLSAFGKLQAQITALASTVSGLIVQTITNGDTTHAPSGDAVFDALALKAPLLRPQFTDWVGVGVAPDRPFVLSTTSNPGATGSSSFLIQGDTNKERLECRSAGDASADPAFQTKRAGGSIASPSATGSGALMMIIGASGHDGTDWVLANRGQIRFTSAEAWTPTAQGVRLAFMTTNTGSTASTARWGIEPGGDLIPFADNAYQFGGASVRPTVLWAVSGTISTSDAREKTAVIPMTDAEIAFSRDLAGEIGTFQWLASISEKGAENARHHVGVTVQRCIELAQANGLDPFRYAFICYDEWDDIPEQRDEETGDVIQECIQAGTRYSLRTDQLAMFLARGLDARLKALES